MYYNYENRCKTELTSTLDENAIFVMKNERLHGNGKSAWTCSCKFKSPESSVSEAVSSESYRFLSDFLFYSKQMLVGCCQI